MNYQAKYGQYYIIKIFALVLVAVFGELFIWWAMVREESVDLIAGQILHNPWPYAVSQLDDGRVIVGNIVKGFEVTLPVGWGVEELRHPSFYFDRAGETICQVKTNLAKYKEKVEVAKLLSEQDGTYVRTYIGGFPAIAKEQVVQAEEESQSGNFVYELQIPIERDVIIYTLVAKPDDRNECRQQFERIRQSFLYYE